MALKLRYPNINAYSEQEKQLKSYLFQLVDELQFAFDNIEKSFEQMKEAAKGASGKQLATEDVATNIEKFKAFIKSTNDVIVEQGTFETDIGTWQYRKWKHGTYQMFGSFEITPAESTLNKTVYYTNPINISSPFKISSAYVTGTAAGYRYISDGGIAEEHDGIFITVIGDSAFDTSSAIEVSLAVMGNYE